MPNVTHPCALLIAPVTGLTVLNFDQQCAIEPSDSLDPVIFQSPLQHLSAYECQDFDHSFWSALAASQPPLTYIRYDNQFNLLSDNSLADFNRLAKKLPELYWMTINGSELATVLEGLPFLTRLAVRYQRDFTVHSLCATIRVLTNPLVCPLEHLDVIADCENMDWSDDESLHVFRRLLTSPALQKLKFIQISNIYMEPDEFDRLNEIFASYATSPHRLKVVFSA